MTERLFKPEGRLARKAAQSSESAESAEHDVVALQRLVGNRAVQHMMGRGTTVQRKMNVTAANDAGEQEADAVADQVMRMKDVPVQRAPEEEEQMQAMRIQRAPEEEEQMQAMRIQRAPEEEEQMQAMRIQRAPEEEEEIQAMRIQRAPEEEEQIQAKGDMMDSFDVSQSVEQGIQSERGGGESLPSDSQDFFSQRMGADFSGVRVHTGEKADGLNGSIQAKAFTTGSDIFFAEGQYNPQSADGQRLLAHELTHVVQQGAAVQSKREDAE
jgi:hypothetical protein